MAEQEIRSLSSYFEDGAIFGEGDNAKQLSPLKMHKVITSHLSKGEPLYKKVFAVQEHFYVDAEGKVHTFASSGEFRTERAKNHAEDWVTRSNRNGKEVVTPAIPYRDYAILDVAAFEKWVAKTLLDNPQTLAVLRGRGGEAKKTTSNKPSLKDFMSGKIPDLDALADAQHATVATRKARGAGLASDRKKNQESSKSGAKKK
ncbi:MULTISPECIES: hypothetical protein [Deinococcus]|uniref:Uncharacterized protein n=1 Tax=Deinococcus rufus TaxID=2136097 RepID=A0ABV7Z8R4_9DEIO|nr:hypothetical protein [Deinococcus sp. AB2017081]WQE94442.1 hypothetical protein U2P90_13635 [Deinococcus sp. AB2017081]